MGVCISLLRQHEQAALLHRCLSYLRLPAALKLFSHLYHCSCGHAFAAPPTLCRPACT